MDSTKNKPLCVRCREPLEGRKGKLFCTVSCKSAYHYEKNREKEASFYTQVDTQIKRNHRLLKHFNSAGKSTVRSEKLISNGFDPSYFTHYWRTQDKRTYFFCYDMGYYKKKENNHDKYVLVHWQDYMKPASPKAKTEE